MPTLDQRLNFAKVIVSTGYNAAATTIVLGSGEGSKLPGFAGNPYNVTWWNSTDFADPADDPTKEIVRVTGRSGDSLTVTRAQEGTSAANHNTGGKVYKMALCVTKKMIDDIEAVTTGLTKCSFFAGLAGTQSVPTAATQVQFVDIEDDGGLYNSGTYQFVCNKVGVYFFGASVEAVSATDKVLNVQLRKNSTVMQESNSGKAPSTTMHRGTVSAVMTLAINDTVSVWTSHDNATNISLENTNQRSSFYGFCVYNGT